MQLEFASESQAARAAAKNPKRMRALDAAAKVLAKATEPMSANEIVEAMAAKRYWNWREASRHARLSLSRR